MGFLRSKNYHYNCRYVVRSERSRLKVVLCGGWGGHIDQNTRSEISPSLPFLIPNKAHCAWIHPSACPLYRCHTHTQAHTAGCSPITHSALLDFPESGGKREISSRGRERWIPGHLKTSWLPNLALDTTGGKLTSYRTNFESRCGVWWILRTCTV